MRTVNIATALISHVPNYGQNFSQLYFDKQNKQLLPLFFFMYLVENVCIFGRNRQKSCLSKRCHICLTDFGCRTHSTGNMRSFPAPTYDVRGKWNAAFDPFPRFLSNSTNSELKLKCGIGVSFKLQKTWENKFSQFLQYLSYSLSNIPFLFYSIYPFNIHQNKIDFLAKIVLHLVRCSI